VRSARGRFAGVVRSFWFLDNDRSEAADERIALEARRTGADGVVVDDLAMGANSAAARARVDTVLVGARVDLRALGADYALWFAGGRNSLVALQTGADGDVSIGQTSAVRTAR